MCSGGQSKVRRYSVGNRQPLWIFAIWTGLFALSGCQQAMRMPDAATAAASESSASLSADVAPHARLPANPPCPDDLTAVLSSGLVVRFMGSTDDDSNICIQRWNGRSYRYYLGFWGNGRFEQGTPEQRKALAAILQGPVGTTTTVDLRGTAAGALWKSATVTHEAHASLRVGRHRRPAVKLRVVRRDALGRSSVTAERLYWLDRETGIPLKKEMVIRMADGRVLHVTTWDVSAVRSTSAETTIPGPGVSNVD